MIAYSDKIPDLFIAITLPWVNKLVFLRYLFKCVVKKAETCIVWTVSLICFCHIRTCSYGLKPSRKKRSGQPRHTVLLHLVHLYCYGSIGINLLQYSSIGVEVLCSEKFNNNTISIVMAGKQVLSSLPLEMLLYLNGFYLGFFFIAEVLLFVYKGEVLYYASDNLALDVILLFLLGGMETLRIFFASKGNLTERTLTMLGSVVLLIPTAVLVVYFLLWQTYVLRIDVIITAIFLGLQCIELVLSLVSMVIFGRHTV